MAKQIGPRQLKQAVEYFDTLSQWNVPFDFALQLLWIWLYKRGLTAHELNADRVLAEFSARHPAS